MKGIPMNCFDHEKLDVYKVAVEFVILSNEITEQLPRGKSYLADQLQRASSSISLNIAEGAGEFSSSEKCRFYRMAKRSATECAGILDLCV
jgi:four helix bundle protein